MTRVSSILSIIFILGIWSVLRVPETRAGRVIALRLKLFFLTCQFDYGPNECVKIRHGGRKRKLWNQRTSGQRLVKQQRERERESETERAKEAEKDYINILGRPTMTRNMGWAWLHTLLSWPRGQAPRLRKDDTERQEQRHNKVTGLYHIWQAREPLVSKSRIVKVYNVPQFIAGKINAAIALVTPSAAWYEPANTCKDWLAEEWAFRTAKIRDSDRQSRRNWLTSQTQQDVLKAFRAKLYSASHWQSQSVWFEVP